LLFVCTLSDFAFFFVPHPLLTVCILYNLTSEWLDGDWKGCHEWYTSNSGNQATPSLPHLKGLSHQIAHQMLGSDINQKSFARTFYSRYLKKFELFL
jgi:hypothetical protein